MRALTVLALLALAGPAPAMADTDVYQPPDLPGSVTVYRGGAAAGTAPIAVYRGSAVRPGYAAPQQASTGVATVGGRQIWFVDRARDVLTGCRMVNALNVGDRRIRCTRAALPD